MTEPTTIYSGKKAWSRRDPGLPPSPQLRWAEANREKLKSQAAVRVALRQKKLTRGKCEICGSLRVDAHHDDYSKPLEVRWLCRRHHQQWHAALRKIESGDVMAEVESLLRGAA